MGRPIIEGENPVGEIETELAVSRVPRDTRNRRGKTGGPSSKPKYYSVTDSEEYCEGKVKSTPGGE